MGNEISSSSQALPQRQPVRAPPQDAHVRGQRAQQYTQPQRQPQPSAPSQHQQHPQRQQYQQQHQHHQQYQQHQIQQPRILSENLEQRYQSFADTRYQQQVQQVAPPEYRDRIHKPVIHQQVPHKSSVENVYQQIYNERQLFNQAYPCQQQLTKEQQQPLPHAHAHTRAPSAGISIPLSSSSASHQPQRIRQQQQQQQQLVATGAPSLTPPIRRSDFDRAEALRIQEFKKGEDARRKQFEDDQRRRRFEFNQQLQQMEKHLDTAYSVLGMSPSQDFTMEELKRAYKKAALRHHPDRPHGNAELFQLVTKSFMLLAEKYKKEFHQSKTFEEMVSERGREQQHGATGATAMPPQQDRFKIGSGERFDAARFNKIYAENRLYDINDEGYGDWLSSQEHQQQEQQHQEDPAIFSEKFNLNVFNVMFDNMKRDDPGAQAALIKVETPQALQVREDNGKFGMLGQDNVADFSGYTSNLNYSDLKQAHTNTRLIDANGLQYKEYRNLDEFQKHRESTSFEITDDDRAAQDRIAAEQQREEKRRKKQVAINDRMYEEHHQRVQQRFITE